MSDWPDSVATKNSVPVELIQVINLPKQKISFAPDSFCEACLIVDTEDMVVGLLELNPGQEIPKHFDNVDKSFYVLEGTADTLISNETSTIGPDNALFVSNNSVIFFKNAGNAVCRIFFFYSSGPWSSVQHYEVDRNNDDAFSATVDLDGNTVDFIDDKQLPLEGWDGVLPPGEGRPITWKTLIDIPSMILGHVRMDPSYPGEAHFHAQPEAIIFLSGEGTTRIHGQTYAAVGPLSAIHVPSNAVHHTLPAAAAGGVLSAVYFFPQGPFREVTYHFVDPLSEEPVSH